ncbi:MAG: hypothetical protein LBT47_02235 [Deltaproteobacteria bacterium]|jgi:nucleoside phosphorylase|nr:hypothetical protein [Deltaproteobacteria bacterium]
MKSGREILILTPTPNEYRSVSQHVGRASFKNFTSDVVECGPGKISATFTATKEIMARKNFSERGILVGAGTCGSLSLELVGGDVIVSSSGLISDWRMEDGQSVKVSPYAWFDYREPDTYQVERMVLECRDTLVTDLMKNIPHSDFRFGRMLTSDVFVSGKDYKLYLGRTFGCLACDMESAVFGYVAGQLLNLPWFNFRVVADTLEDSLSSYFAMEKDMTEILGRKVVEGLKVLDSIL